MPKPRFYLAFSAACLLLGAGVLHAQQDASKEVTAKLVGGKYNDLNVWRAMKLGTAPFVNPGLLEQTSVAYKYDPETLSAAQDWVSIATMAEAGEIGIGVPTDDGYIVAALDDANWPEAVGIEKDWWSGDPRKQQ